MPVWWGRCPPHSSRRPGRGMCRGAGSGPRRSRRLLRGTPPQRTARPERPRPAPARHPGAARQGGRSPVRTAQKGPCRSVPPVCRWGGRGVCPGPWSPASLASLPRTPAPGCGRHRHRTGGRSPAGTGCRRPGHRTGGTGTRRRAGDPARKRSRPPQAGQGPASSCGPLRLNRSGQGRKVLRSGIVPLLPGTSTGTKQFFSRQHTAGIPRYRYTVHP